MNVWLTTGRMSHSLTLLLMPIWCVLSFAVGRRHAEWLRQVVQADDTVEATSGIISVLGVVRSSLTHKKAGVYRFTSLYLRRRLAPLVRPSTCRGLKICAVCGVSYTVVSSTSKSKTARRDRHTRLWIVCLRRQAAGG
ncbi:hypothetical protein C8T65DRAFT_628726 [Cerioporus squamosus]|nr:hypothetical protein C8T65DRAFT_628726 [Cerioporus squamosus]